MVVVVGMYVGVVSIWALVPSVVATAPPSLSADERGEFGRIGDDGRTGACGFWAPCFSVTAKVDVMSLSLALGSDEGATTAAPTSSATTTSSTLISPVAQAPAALVVAAPSPLLAMA